MEIILTIAYIIGRLIYEGHQRRKADEYANMVVRRH